MIFLPVIDESLNVIALLIILQFAIESAKIIDELLCFDNFLSIYRN